METEQTLIRFVRLRNELKPVEICISPTQPTISPDWLGISRCRSRNPHRTDVREDFILHFFMDNGEELTWEQFDTLDIALDQAIGIVGVKRRDWHECHHEIRENDRIAWEQLSS